MSRGEKTRELWKNTEYRERMSKAHKGKVPSNLPKLIELSKSAEGRARVSNMNKGRTAWNKGKENPSFKGEKHWAWKGGITPKEKAERGVFKHLVQRKVFERDGYTCKMCGQIGGNLQVDHIQPWSEYVEGRFDMNNCRTLCMECHYLITFGKVMPEEVTSWGHNFSERRVIT